MIRVRHLAALGALIIITGACASTSSSSGSASVTLVSHDSFVATQSVLDGFTADTGVKLDVPKGTGDAGAVLAKAILAKGNPEGDVLWGVDNTLLSKAVDAGVFEPYASPALPQLDPTTTVLVPGHELTPVDVGYVCVNVDKAFYAGAKGPAPTTLDDLIKPAYKDQLVVQNPATSSPGLVFLLATVAKYGDTWPDYWKALRANGVKVTEGWTEAYSTDFSGSTGKGARPLVVSYASSPVAEVVFAPDPKPTTPPTATFTDGCFRQVEFVGILKGSKHVEAAKKLIDFLVSKPFQQDMALNMFVSPALTGAALPTEFTSFTVTPDAPLNLAPAEIAANRDKWVEEWTNIVLR